MSATSASESRPTSTAEEVVSTEVKVCTDCTDRACSLTPKACDMARELHRNLSMGADAYLNLLPYVKSPELKTDMTAALCYYEKTAGKVREALARTGEEAPEAGMMAKFSARMGTAINTAIDKSESHIAQMLMEGCTMSVTAANRLANGAEGQEDCRELRDLCLEWSAFEERHGERLKAYL